MKHCGIIASVLLFVFLTLSLSGCWNRRELDTLAIVSGVALDKPKETDQIMITTQIIKPSQIKPTSSSGGETGGSSPYFNLTETGTSLFETIRKMTETCSRKLYWPHNHIIIISWDLAEEGIRKYMDLFIRDPEARLLVFILISKGQAKDILEEKPDLKKIPAMEIAEIVKASGATSFAPQITLKDFSERLLSKTTSPVAPIILLTGEGKGKRAHVAGTAVFKQDKLVGELDEIETRGFLWVAGKIKSGIINVECLQGKGQNSLEIIRANKKIIPEIKDGHISITIKIKEEGNLVNQMNNKDLSEPAAWEDLKKRQAAAIEGEIRAALKKAQELNTDIFGFGDSIHKKYPELWKEIEPKWDELFPSLETNVVVDAKLHHPGKLTKPLYPAEES